MKKDKESAILSMESIEEAIKSGTFKERMQYIVLYYAHKSYHREPPFTEPQLNRLRTAAAQDIREGNYCKMGAYLKEEQPLSPAEQKKRVDNFSKWEIIVEIASKWAEAVVPSVERYKAKLYSFKALLEEYQAIRTIEALADKLLEKGESAEAIEKQIEKQLHFSDGRSPYTIRLDINGKAAALYMNHKTARDIELQIKETAAELNKNLTGYKASAEAILSYFKRIKMEAFVDGALRFSNQRGEMVVAALDIVENGAYLSGSTPHKESPFPDILQEYDNIRISKEEREENNTMIIEAVAIQWKQRGKKY